MNATPHIIPSALLLLLAFLIGCVIGYLLRRLLAPHRPASVVEEQPVEIEEDIRDDLKKIKGIGPKMEAMLHENGIYRFSQIAQWDAETVAEMNERLSFGNRIGREEWVAQAEELRKSPRP